ncbi:dNTP triphosphohydrolase [Pseudonocardia aurantiaca]
MLDHGARAARRSPVEESGAGLANSPFRVDRDRIAASPFFARLAGVTQVVSPTGNGLLLHNRLTHSLQVAQVARALAERLCGDPATAAQLDALGGLDADVVEAAALAHDLGHPPFGHLGEQVLDRLGRGLGLADGFEGNAQTFRIVTTTDLHGPGRNGLDLTAAVRAAVLKYPWARLGHPDPHPSKAALPPRGAGPLPGAPDAGSAKFCSYLTELDDLVASRAPFAGAVGPWQQTVEAAVMDTADDIAYAIHDLEDFHRVGVLQQPGVAAELGGWLRDRTGLAAADPAALGSLRPGADLEWLRRRLRDKDSWAFSDEAFAAAVAVVRGELVDGLLAVPFDGSMAAERAVAEFSARWTARLVGGVRVLADPPVRAAPVLLAEAPWHEVAVLKFVHHRFVLQRADLASYQRGQATVLSGLVGALADWLTDDDEPVRLPPRLHDLVALAHEEYRSLAADGLLGPDPDVDALARARAVLDYVASLTDGQAAALLDVLTGRSARLWTDAVVL